MPSLQAFLIKLRKTDELSNVKKCARQIMKEFNKILKKMKEKGLVIELKAESKEHFLARNLEVVLFHEKDMCQEVRDEAFKEIEDANKTRAVPLGKSFFTFFCNVKSLIIYF